VKNIKYYVGFVLLSVSILNGVGHLVAYFYSNKHIDKALSFPNVIVYISMPVFFLTLLILVYSFITDTKSKLRVTFAYGFIAHILLIVLLYYYFKNESNKLGIVIRNLSSYSIHNIKVNARNDQQFDRATLMNGGNMSILCECRNITYSDSVGINLQFEFSESQPKFLTIISSNEPVYSDSLRIVIINDTLTVTNYGVKDQWKRLERFSPIYTTEEINKLIKNR
jgi:hypothetical protein